MMPQITLDIYSLAAIPVETYFDSQPLGWAAAFAWQAEDAALLITNWHVVSGKNVFTRQHVSPTLAEPNKIRYVWDSKHDPGKIRVSEEFDLRGANGDPLWWVHPQHGSSIDIVAFLLKPNADAG
jgi:hypothetical protein